MPFGKYPYRVGNFYENYEIMCIFLSVTANIATIPLYYKKNIEERSGSSEGKRVYCFSGDPNGLYARV